MIGARRLASICARPMQRLDRSSQIAVRGCMERAFLMSAFMLVLWMLGIRSFAQVCASLPVAFNLAAGVAIILALRHREQAGRGSLNRWDEALAFNGIAVLARILEQVPK